jgi:hypothetical protein
MLTYPLEGTRYLNSVLHTKNIKIKTKTLHVLENQFESIAKKMQKLHSITYQSLTAHHLLFGGEEEIEQSQNCKGVLIVMQDCRSACKTYV